jgi:hypothetical protein
MTVGPPMFFLGSSANKRRATHTVRPGQPSVQVQTLSLALRDDLSFCANSDHNTCSGSNYTGATVLSKALIRKRGS